MTIVVVSYFLLLIIALFSFGVIEADINTPIYLTSICSLTQSFKPNKTYKTTQSKLLFSTNYHATGTTKYYDTSYKVKKTNETIYGQFMCRGDVPPKLCAQCVGGIQNDTLKLSKQQRKTDLYYIYYFVCVDKGMSMTITVSSQKFKCGVELLSLDIYSTMCKRNIVTPTLIAITFGKNLTKSHLIVNFNYPSYK